MSGKASKRALTQLLGRSRFVSGYGLKRGMASLCIGGGEATAMAIELV